MAFDNANNIDPGPADHPTNTRAWFTGGALVVALLVAGGWGYAKYYVGHDVAGPDSASVSADASKERSGKAQGSPPGANAPAGTTGSGAAGR
jgi:hypothetical protein